jgi:ubiquinone/menaquinone biosynthesis C-methylase UbiE
MLNPKERFTNRVEDYKKYRPSYPSRVISFLIEKCSLSSSSTIADIGSGTGIFTKQLLEKGFTVKSVEPNESMRKQAEDDLSSFSKFESINGCAENTTLESGSIDLITCCQSFHWFDHDKCKVEFQRITKGDGWVALIWNERLSDTPFMMEFNSLLKDEFLEFANRRVINEEVISSFYAPSPYQVLKCPNKQILDLRGVKGRLSSSSYAPQEGEEGHDEAFEKLERLFEEHNENGFVDFNYSAAVYLGRIK